MVVPIGIRVFVGVFFLKGGSSFTTICHFSDTFFYRQERDERVLGAQTMLDEIRQLMTDGSIILCLLCRRLSEQCVSSIQQKHLKVRANHTANGGYVPSNTPCSNLCSLFGCKQQLGHFENSIFNHKHQQLNFHFPQKLTAAPFQRCQRCGGIS